MTSRRYHKMPADQRVVPGGRPQLCDLCAALTYDGTEQYATVPDSSAVYPSPSRFDGQRRLSACSAAHMDELRYQYATRPYDDAELLACIVARAQRRMGHEASLDDLAFVTGLTMAEILRAKRWQSIWMTWLDDQETLDI